MKKYTIYYVIGAVLVGAGIYLYATRKNKQDNDVESLLASQEVEEPTKKVPDLATPPIFNF